MNNWKSGIETLYKYTSEEGAISILENHVFRIGTLYGYRDTETHGTQIGDTSEGQKSVYTYDNPEDWKDENTKNYLGKYFFKNGRNKKSKNNLLIGRHKSEDMYIFCASDACDFQLMRQMGYEVAIKIDNRDDAFFRALSTAMQFNLRLEPENRMKKCIYRNTSYHASLYDDIHPVFIKRAEHEYQKEVRMAWKPRKNIFNPVYIICYEAALLCSRIEM